MAEILPSILSADFARLGEQLSVLEQAGCGMVHVDVMDGHFVPNITLGPPVVASLRKATRMTLDVHLMISDPDRYAPLFIEAGADQVSVHQETCPHLDRTVKMIQGLGARAGVVVNPATSVDTLDDVLGFVDFVLIMSVNPGFGGQTFIPDTLDKVRRLAARKRERGLTFPIEIDGGVTRDNVGEVVRAGVEWVVAGSAVFGNGSPAVNVTENFNQLRQQARAAEMVRV
ncbi:MAG: ribulose-phosphate 3-epimerase [Acidobacteria bacterium]|nr:ribulose-phosphate 3-epimerase [Acidobacteriota bacterium]